MSPVGGARLPILACSPRGPAWARLHLTDVSQDGRYSIAWGKVRVAMAAILLQCYESRREHIQDAHCCPQTPAASICM